MLAINYIKFRWTVRKRNICWTLLFNKREKHQLTDTLIDVTIDKLSDCDNKISRMKKEFGYGCFEKVY